MLGPRHRHGADERAVIGVLHLDHVSSVETSLPAMRIASLRAGSFGMIGMVQASTQVERDVEGIEGAQAMARGDRELPVRDHRHALLGEAAMAAQRLGEAREIMLVRRRAERDLWRVEITTRSPRRSGGSSKRRRPRSRVSATCTPGELQFRDQRFRDPRLRAGRSVRKSRARRGGPHRGR
jgi:hypothetical protein